jgi:2-dehydro-3-deoxyphosphooctonate aldolase (KDO 8-P synthase)
MSAPNATVTVGDVRFGNHLPLTLIAGPCQMESRDHAFDIAGSLKQICAGLGIGLVYKSSFDKANRTSLGGKRGAGLEARPCRCLPISRPNSGLPVLTDIHTEEQCAIVAPIVDMLQIPAFLCRQTDLLIAAAKTGKVINVKKGQFLAPWDMKNVLAKITGAAMPMCCSPSVAPPSVTTRWSATCGRCRSWPHMGAPVVFDATHSVQQPGGQGGASGGERRICRDALARGGRGWRGRRFIETHEDPDNARQMAPT